MWTLWTPWGRAWTRQLASRYKVGAGGVWGGPVDGGDGVHFPVVQRLIAAVQHAYRAALGVKVLLRMVGG